MNRSCSKPDSRFGKETQTNCNFLQLPGSHFELHTVIGKYLYKIKNKNIIENPQTFYKYNNCNFINITTVIFIILLDHIILKFNMYLSWEDCILISGKFPSDHEVIPKY